MRRLRIFSFILLAVLFSCHSTPSYKKADIPETELNFETNRFDLDLFGTDFSDPARARKEFSRKYRSFYCDYVEDVLKAGPCESDSTVLLLKTFTLWPDMIDLQREVESTFTGPSVELITEEFGTALNRWHFFFPDSLIPNLIYMNSGLNYSAYCTDSTLAVGLDYFLGPENKLMRNLPGDLFPQYLKDDMRSDYLIVNTIKDFSQRETAQASTFPERPDLLSMLIFHGKAMYLTDLLLPDAADSTKMNWSSKQADWAADNEWNLWKQLAMQDVMFGTDAASNSKWFEFGPFTNAGDVPQDSPPQLGIYMGWKIVRAYMQDHEEISPSELLHSTKDRDILKTYKPDRPK
jgi:hypothetical protein